MTLYDRIVAEYKICKENSARHEIPCGWNNLEAADSVANLLGHLLSNCNHEKYPYWGSFCTKCRVTLDFKLGMINKCGKHNCVLFDHEITNECWGQFIGLDVP